MTAPCVSITTPARLRTQFLPRIARCVLAQTVSWEWVVHDDSPTPDAFMQRLARDDARVRYIHSPEPMTIGAKRNAMIDAACSPHIAHFDDDDVYTPTYLEHMLATMTQAKADMLKLSGFFLYAPACDFFGYLDLQAATGWHFHVTGDNFVPIDLRGENKPGEEFPVFYGFSYLYRRDLAMKLYFEDVSLFEDARFAVAWVNRGYNFATTNFAARECLHYVHPGSTARTLATYRIPNFMMHDLFPYCAQLDAEYTLTFRSVEQVPGL